MLTAIQQFCVDPLPSALKVTLPAFAALSACVPAANPPHAAATVDRWDRQAERGTDARPLKHGPALHRLLCAGSVNKTFSDTIRYEMLF